MKETNIVQTIRLECSGQAVLFRNNTGKLPDKNGRWVEYGLCVGSSDLIGWRKSDGRFIAIEVKAGKEQPTAAQVNFLEQVKKSGGLAGVARSVDEAKNIILGA